MYLDNSIRTQFAESIAEAVGIEGTDKGKIFVKKFAGLDKLQKINGSHTWIDKVVYWIKYDNRSEIAKLINANYNNPQAVLDYIIEHKKPI